MTEERRVGWVKRSGVGWGEALREPTNVPNKFQYIRSQSQNLVGNPFLAFGHSDFDIVWNLVLGIWNLLSMVGSRNHPQSTQPLLRLTHPTAPYHD
ncbi:MAG: hypothetical protein HY673_19210 [Chloroflexi bacterium]|nr:hypothetical protein [Chloroflexota bacterium]